MLSSGDRKKTVLAHDRIHNGPHEAEAHVQMLIIERECDGGSETHVYGKVSDE